jgi:glycosyltransferase involved in cell wall biosynthesis
MKTAIVVPVKNERAGLERLARHLINQISSEDVLIFVDAGSTDGTQEFIKSLSSKHEHVHFLISEGAFCGNGRNVAIRQTDADIIVHIDGGNIPEDTWFSKITTPIKQDTADYVTGNIAFLPIPQKVLGIEMDFGKIYALSLFRDFHRKDDGKMAGGSSVAYRKWVWDKVGGFPDFCSFGGEDVLFVKKIERLAPSLRTTFVKNAIVYWQIGPGLKNALKRKFRFQTHLFYMYEDIQELLRGCLIPSILIFMAAASFIFPVSRLPLLILFLFEWARQAAKVIRLFFKRQKHASIKKILLSTGYLIFIEGLNLLARMTGVIVGLITIRDSIEFRKKASEYLRNTENV